MQAADLEALQRLYELKSKGVLTEAEYDRKKAEILNAPATPTEMPAAAVVRSPMLGHGVSLLVGGVVLLLIVCGVLSADQPSQGDLQEALGCIIIFGIWLIPHSIWLMTKSGANLVLPTITLALIGLSALVYAGNL